MLGKPKWSLRVTHTPTGLEVDVNSDFFRHQWQAREAAEKLMQARLKERRCGQSKALEEFNARRLSLHDTYQC